MLTRDCTCQIFQWKGDKGCITGLKEWKEKDKTHLGEELSDCLLYLVRLADKCDVDLPAAVARKVAQNAAKYPADKCKGKSDKYTAYQDEKPKVHKIAAYEELPKKTCSEMDEEPQITQWQMNAFVGVTVAYMVGWLYLNARPTS